MPGLRLGPSGNCYDLPVTTRVYLSSFVLSSTLLLATACSKDAPEKGSAEAKPAEAAQRVEKSSAEVEETPAPSPAIDASEEERAIAKVFIAKFLAAIASEKVEDWSALFTKASWQIIVDKGDEERSYKAWQIGTKTVVQLIAESEFKLIKAGSKMTLSFPGVMVPNDPETEYSMQVLIEDGTMYIAEN